MSMVQHNQIHDYLNQIKFDNSRLIGHHKLIRVMLNIMPYNPLLNDSIHFVQAKLKYKITPSRTEFV